MEQPTEQAPAAPEQDEFDKLNDEWLLFKNHVIEVKERVEKGQNEELEEAKLTIEALKRTNHELQNDIERLEEEKDRLEMMNDELENQNTDLQAQIIELTTKEEEETNEEPEEPQPTPAVPAPAQPITIRKLQKWVFIQYLLQVDPSKKYYNTFRSKWIKVYILAKHNGGKFYEDVDALNHQSIESLDGMINRLEDLYIQYEFDEILAAIAYLKKARDEYPNA